jgi:putative endonuclease
MTSTQVVGRWGENQAVAFLLRKGFVVVERNYHTTVGEIDIVARSNEDWYFIEVKTRRAGELATDLSITPAKKRKFEKTITQYCYKRNVLGGSYIMAGLMVVFDSATKKVAFRLAVFC